MEGQREREAGFHNTGYAIQELMQAISLCRRFYGREACLACMCNGLVIAQGNLYSPAEHT